MEPVVMEEVARQRTQRHAQAAGRRREQFSFAFYLLPFALSLAGCVGTSPFVYLGGETHDGVPCQVVAAWNPGVVKTPDSVHDGDETPGLVGRIYLFGAEVGAPLIGDGSMVVDLYDDTAGPAAKRTPALEEWHFDREMLKRLQRRDAIGWGYTLFLPWATYKPEINRVHLKVRYLPPKGVPLYAASAPMTLGDPEQMKKLATGLVQSFKRNEAGQREAPGQTTPPVQGIATVAGQQRQ